MTKSTSTAKAFSKRKDVSFTGVPVLDHAVINVKDDLDAAVDRYTRLGFRFSARGHHSLGSSNNLATFGENYLELLGVEPLNAHKRMDLMQAPTGLNAVVFKTSDAHGLQASLSEKGLSDLPVRSFSRPILFQDNEHEVCFNTVHFTQDPNVLGRCFFCEHLTPHLVWQDELMLHPNGVLNIAEFIFVAQDPNVTLTQYARLFDEARVESDDDKKSWIRAGAATVTALTPRQFKESYDVDFHLPEGYSSAMAALRFHTSSLENFNKMMAADPDLTVILKSECTVVPASEAFGVTLIFSD